MPRLLIIDDECHILSALKRLLVREGYDVVCALDPTNALKLVKTQQFDIIIADYRMPYMNGVEFLRLSRPYQPFSFNFLLSGDVDLECVVECMNEDAAQRFLRKPWDNKKLLMEVKKGAQKVARLRLEVPNIERQTIVNESSVSVVNIHSHEFQLFWESVQDHLWQHTFLIDFKWPNGEDTEFKRKRNLDALCCITEEITENIAAACTVVEIDEYEVIVVITVTDKSYSSNIVKKVAKLFDARSRNNSVDPAYISYQKLAGHSTSFTRALLSTQGAWRQAVNPRYNYAYSNASTTHDIERQRLDALRKAVSNDELFLVYQPKYCAKKLKITGIECLLRWHNKGLGAVSPNLFIPLAEENGIIDEIGGWVLQQIVNFQQQLTALGRSDDIKIAINVSPHQLKNSQFISLMNEVTENKLLRASGVRLEITESAAIDDFTWCAEQLTQLQKLGFEIAIDDFGTGFTSLQYLLHLPVHVIKLDRSLIQEVDSSEKSFKIISSLVDMAHATGLKVVAEGVERDTQLKSMQAMHCDELQGFYLSKPLSEHGIKEVLTQD